MDRLGNFVGRKKTRSSFRGPCQRHGIKNQLPSVRDLSSIHHFCEIPLNFQMHRQFMNKWLDKSKEYRSICVAEWKMVNPKFINAFEYYRILKLNVKHCTTCNFSYKRNRAAWKPYVRWLCNRSVLLIFLCVDSCELWRQMTANDGKLTAIIVRSLHNHAYVHNDAYAMELAVICRHNWHEERHLFQIWSPDRSVIEMRSRIKCNSIGAYCIHVSRITFQN